MHITDRLYEKKWGVFNHYASHIFNAREGRAWTELVGRLDVKKIARALYEMGAGYYFITLTHGTKHMLAPNATYDALLDAKPGENCAERDVILELHDALSAYGIDLYLYFNASGPVSDRAVAERLGYWYSDSHIWTPRKGLVPYNWRDAVVLKDGVELDFIKKWSGVLREYSLRYGDKIAG